MPIVDKVRSGEPFRPEAQSWNGLVDGLGGQRGPPSDNDPRDSQLSGDFIWVQNDTNATLGKWKVLGLDAPLLDPSSSADELIAFQQKPIFRGTTPNSTTHWNRPVVTLETIGPGRIGLCLISGVVPVQVNVQHTSHVWADVADTVDNLKSYTAGSARILSAITATGLQWCLVELGVKMRSPRLARTVLDYDSTYPLQGVGDGANVFPFKFLTGGFENEAGRQDGEFLVESDEINYCFVRSLNWIPRGTNIQVWYDRGTNPALPGAWWCEFIDRTRLGKTLTVLDSDGNLTWREWETGFNAANPETPSGSEWIGRSWLGAVAVNTKIYFTQIGSIAYIINKACDPDTGS